MFTGIIEEVGRLEKSQNGNDSARLFIRASRVLDGTSVGDSIAVSGVCLTVTDLEASGFWADAMPETLRRSTLGSLRPGDKVNLERALLPTTRLGGHIVSGHIDGTGSIRSIRAEGIASVITIEADASMTRYMVEKGSVALSGVSLTLTDVASDSFSVSLIPHTASETTLGSARKGDMLNIECDIVGKYVWRLLSFAAKGGSRGSGHGVSDVGDFDSDALYLKLTPDKGNSREGGFSMDFLAQNGFI